MSEVKDTANEVVEAFDGTETYDEAEYALRDFSSKEISVTNAMRAAADTGSPGVSGGWPTVVVVPAATSPVATNGSWTLYYGLAAAPLKFADANGEWIEFELAMRAGVWALDLFALKGNFAGIGTFSIDGVDLDDSPHNASSATLDFYNASDQSQVYNVASDIEIPEDDYHTLRITITDKNASSSGFQIGFYKLVLAKVGDLP